MHEFINNFPLVDINNSMHNAKLREAEKKGFLPIKWICQTL